MGTYASDTSVSSDKSRAEIERTLARYGADSFMYGWDRKAAIVGFIANGRTVGQWVIPQIDQVYEGGRMPELLPGSGS